VQKRVNAKEFRGGQLQSLFGGIAYFRGE